MADPFKSLTTTSNRFSNSIDSAAINNANNYGRNFGQKTANDNNTSVVDADNSYFFEDKDDKVKAASASERMHQTAQLLGQFNLTIDLGCLLSQKRRQQLDQVAKIACFQGSARAVLPSRQSCLSWCLALGPDALIPLYVMQRSTA